MASMLTTVTNTGRMNLEPNLIAECAPTKAPAIKHTPIVKPSTQLMCPRNAKVIKEVKLLVKFIAFAKPEASKIFSRYSAIELTVQKAPVPGLRVRRRILWISLACTVFYEVLGKARVLDFDEQSGAFYEKRYTTLPPK